MKVFVKRGNFERAQRQFKRGIIEEGLLLELREREYYEKPSDKRRRKHKAAVNRSKKGKEVPKKYF